jgi:hypothetical protein
VTLQKDDEDFKRSDYFDKREGPFKICRGRRLFPTIEAIASGGWKTDVDAVGGFSEDRQVCKKFAKGGYTREGPPAVYIADRYHYQEQEPTLQAIQYDEKWLDEHPEVVRICQTLPDMRRSHDEERSSAMCYSREKEWAVVGKNVLRPLDLVRKYTVGENDEEHEYRIQGSLNIYLDGQELDQMRISNDSYHEQLPSICKAMNEAHDVLEKAIPSDLPVEEIRLYYCDNSPDAFSMHTSCYKDNNYTCQDKMERANCILHSRIKPKGKPMSEGIERKAYKEW